MRPVMRSESWSKICRDRAKSYINQINAATGEGEDDTCMAWALRNLSHSYRPMIFKIRVAGMLRRAERTGKVHDNPKAVVLYKTYCEKMTARYGSDGLWS